MTENKTEEKEKELEYTYRTDEELKQIAVDIFDGKIFSNMHLKDQETAKTVFMPLALIPPEYAKQMIKWEISFIYEYLTKAGPLAVNGCPMFFTMNIMNATEHEKVSKYYEEYKKLKEGFVGNTTTGVGTD